MTLFDKIKSCKTVEEMTEILCANPDLGCCMISENCNGGYEGAEDCDGCIRLCTIKDLESEYEESN